MLDGEANRPSNLSPNAELWIFSFGLYWIGWWRLRQDLAYKWCPLFYPLTYEEPLLCWGGHWSISSAWGGSLVFQTTVIQSYRWEFYSRPFCWLQTNELSCSQYFNINMQLVSCFVSPGSKIIHSVHNLKSQGGVDTKCKYFQVQPQLTKVNIKQ